jgi:hypothetical protein
LRRTLRKSSLSTTHRVRVWLLPLKIRGHPSSMRDSASVHKKRSSSTKKGLASTKAPCLACRLRGVRLTCNQQDQPRSESGLPTNVSTKKCPHNRSRPFNQLSSCQCTLTRESRKWPHFRTASQDSPILTNPARGEHLPPPHRLVSLHRVTSRKQVLPQALRN